MNNYPDLLIAFADSILKSEIRDLPFDEEYEFADLAQLKKSLDKLYQAVMRKYEKQKRLAKIHKGDYSQ